MRIGGAKAKRAKSASLFMAFSWQRRSFRSPKRLAVTKGAIGGGIAGHHAIIGAIAGCAIGHHMAVIQKRDEAHRRLAAAHAGAQGGY